MSAQVFEPEEVSLLCQCDDEDCDQFSIVYNVPLTDLQESGHPLCQVCDAELTITGVQVSVV